MTDALRESRRQQELRRLQILDSAEEPAYDDITRRASQLCGTPISLISLIDDERQWFKSRQGLALSETPRTWSFCSHAIQEPDKVLVIEDATRDQRFKDNPLVTGSPGVRFYAGAPLVTRSGEAIGSLCVIDSQPRGLAAAHQDALRALADQVVALMETRTEFMGLFEREARTDDPP